MTAIQLRDAGMRLMPWHKLPPQTDKEKWIEIAGAVLIVVMLVIFYQVVSGAAQRGQAMQRTNAAIAEADARCRAMPNRSSRDSCFARLDTEPEDKE